MSDKWENAMLKAPTAKNYFDLRAICPEVCAAIAITEAQAHSKRSVSRQDQEWFIIQAETWVRWFHANNRNWHARLEREADSDRDFVAMFLNHWAEAFLQDPGSYKERHPILNELQMVIPTGDIAS